MQLSVSPSTQITAGTQHHAFTSCAFWQGRTYVAYREAETHHPVPPGLVAIRRQSALGPQWGQPIILYETEGAMADFRDPRLIATPDALYCLLGAYLPRYPNTTLSLRSSENLIQSFLTYTTDGTAWAPLTPVYRPNYWIWSALPLDYCWVAAAYHTGMPGESSSIHLLSGDSLLHLQPNGAIYDGASVEKEGGFDSVRYRFGHTTVAEPVLYAPAPNTLGCAIRAEDGSKFMEIGVARYPFQDWRWWRTTAMCHPSAIIQTPHGLLLAGRDLRKRETTWRITTSLYHLDAQQPRLLHRLPSAHDTGYAGLCPTKDPTRFLVSYYSQHTTPAPYGLPLPGAQVFVAEVSVRP